MKKSPAPEFDPLAYIEQAFLDRPVEEPDLDSIPSITDYISGGSKRKVLPKEKFRKTEMRAPRPRRQAGSDEPATEIDPALQQVWEALPKNVEFLCQYYDDSVTANYYRGDFRETRQELVRRLLDPELSLEEVSRLLGVVPATVRRYTNRGWMNCHRTPGGQRRFRLSDVVKFVQTHGRFPQE
jgi:excisionase family DNA binding protein